MSYGIRKFWCCTFTQHTSLYLTSYVTDMNYITHRRFSVHFYQPIYWYLQKFWRFCQSSGHRFPPCLHAELPTTCYNHSIVTCKCQYSWRVWTSGVEFRFGLQESKLILKFQLLHISMEKLILISGCYENHCENPFSDSRRISIPELRRYGVAIVCSVCYDMIFGVYNIWPHS